MDLLSLKQQHTENKKKYYILFILSSLVIGLDQLTKHWIHTQFQWGESHPIFESWFALTYVRNQGAAFGLLHKAPAYFREPFFVIVPIVALFVILVVFIRLKATQVWSAVALSLVCGGAFGNLIDRLRFGWVIDFLDLHWKEVYHWPAFNVADSAIVIGVGILFVQTFYEEREELKAK